MSCAGLPTRILNNDIVRGLLRRKPDLDIVRAQDAGLTGLDDPALLAWAAAQDRVLITHDVSTMTAYAHRRMNAGEYHARRPCRSGAPFLSPTLSKTSSCFPSAVPKENGRDRSGIFPYAEAQPPLWPLASTRYECGLGRPGNTRGSRKTFHSPLPWKLSHL